MIPLSVPNINGNEWQYVKDCLDTGWISSAGAYVDKFEQDMADYTGAKYAVACMNGTVGLQIATQVVGVKPGEYVIAPNLTFVATLNGIKYTGAEPILVDVDPHTWQIDLNLLEQFLQTHTQVVDGFTVLKQDGKPVKAIVPVHVLGNMCDMDQLLAICEEYNLKIVEDAAESLGSTYKQKHSGTFGAAGVISFNGNKIISTGGGGMILTDDKAIATHAKKLTTQAKISDDEYDHDEIGYNYRLVNVLAAIGVAQLENLPDVLSRNKARDQKYREELRGIDGIEFQAAGDNVVSNNWLTTFRIDNMRQMLKHLSSMKIQSRPLWRPMNQLPMFQHCHYVSDSDIANQLYSNALSVPSSSGISDQEIGLVIDAIKDGMIKA